MSKIVNQSKLIDLISKELKINKKDINMKSGPVSGIESWDSFSHVGIVLMLEKKFKIKFTLNEISQMQTLSKILQIINKKSK